jgi:hypothetical protein
MSVLESSLMAQWAEVACLKSSGYLGAILDCYRLAHGALTILLCYTYKDTFRG